MREKDSREYKKGIIKLCEDFETLLASALGIPEKNIFVELENASDKSTWLKIKINVGTASVQQKLEDAAYDRLCITRKD